MCVWEGGAAAREHVCNPRTWEEKAIAQGDLLVHCMFEAVLKHTLSCL